MTTSANFNLDAPPNFRGLHPDLPVTVYHRHLPHWRQVGATYFVTFRLGDALPQEKLNFLKRLRDEWERRNPPPRGKNCWEAFAKEYTTQSERWLDEGCGVCHFRERRWANDLANRLNHFQNERYFLSCWVIMPNHCHAVIKPFDGFALEDLIGAMKGVCTRHINKDQGTSGTVWEEESYDRVIRDEEHLWLVVQYIGRNPKLAGLEHEQEWRRWIHSEWESTGLRFNDER